MVTDEMMKRAIEAYAKDTGAEGFQLEGWIEPAIRAALEAALSAVEPVGEVGEMPGSNGGFTMAAFKAADVPIGAKLYVAPPAPSVAVKALADACKAGFDASSQGYNGEAFPEYEADNEWLAQRDSDLSALSAQVQDVAGWQPIETAPKDGSDVLLSSPNWHGDVVVGCWSFEGWRDREDSDKLEPTHWMPLPAAPAKQEGGE